MKCQPISRLGYGLVVALLTMCQSPAARAVDYFFNVANGDYNAGGSWTPSGPPTASDNAFINNGGTATLSTGLGDANAFEIGSAASDSGAIVISGGDFQAMDSIRVGEVGTGTATVTSGAFRAANGTSIFIGGQNSGGTGTLNISGSDSIVRAADDFILGRVGTGTLDFQGGWATGGFTVVGKFGTGLWNQSGGVFEQAFGDIEIGDGGTPDQSDTSGPRIGTINLTGGVMQGAGHLAIGNRVGSGEVNISGGVLSLTGNVGDGSIIIGRGFQWDGMTGEGGPTELRVTGDDSTIIANGSLQMNPLEIASSSTLIAEITGSTHTSIKVAGNAEITNGTFKVELDGYAPVLGDSWTIIEAGADLTADKDAIKTLADSLVTATEYTDEGGLAHVDPAMLGTVVGEFASEDFSMATLPAGLAWDVTYAANTVTLSVIASTVIPGDYDHDGTVDADDYNVWTANFGSTTMLDADGNNNQIVDAADYTVWRDNLVGGAGAAAGLGSSAAVPEPASLLLLLTAIVAVGLVRTRAASNQA